MAKGDAIKRVCLRCRQPMEVKADGYAYCKCGYTDKRG